MKHASQKTVTQNIKLLREQIKALEQKYGRKTGSVQLLAVSKTRPVEDIQAALIENQAQFGENYLQDALTKINSITDPTVEWHFIGPIQSNKTRQIAQNFQWVHTVERLKIAQRLSDQRDPELAPLNVCIQVNSSAEASKSGVQPGETLELAKEITRLPHLKLRGLMTIPAATDDFDLQRQPFILLRELKEQIESEGIELDTLSMGMSNDMEAAIAEGATMVRIGTAIFGQRN